MSTIHGVTDIQVFRVKLPCAEDIWVFTMLIEIEGGSDIQLNLLTADPDLMEVTLEEPVLRRFIMAEYFHKVTSVKVVPGRGITDVMINHADKRATGYSLFMGEGS